MRDDLDSIKIDENGNCEIQELQTCGTLPIRALIVATNDLPPGDPKDDFESFNHKGALYFLLEEKIIELDECLKRLTQESIDSMQKNKRA